jgi:hypothetical protein
MSTQSHANSNKANAKADTDDADGTLLQKALDEGQEQLVAALKSVGKRTEKEIKSRPLLSMLIIFMLGLLLGRAVFRS